MTSPFYVDPQAPVQPDQFKIEFEMLLDIYHKLNPKRVLEIGVKVGGTLYQWLKHTEPGASIVAIDLPHGPWGISYMPNVDDWYKWAGEFGQTLRVFLTNSRYPKTVREVERLGPYDFIFVDGDHTVAGVACDYLTYRRMVRPGGVMVFHDILPDRSDSKIEIYKYWQDIRKVETNMVELTSWQEQGSRGIGVIYV